MKITIKNYYLFFILMVLPLFSSARAPSDNKTFTIISCKQNIRFYQDDDELKAKIEIEEKIKCNIKTGEYFRKYLFFDNTSRIDEILINGRSVMPIISDEVPKSGIFHSDSKLAYVDYRFTTKNEILTISSEKTFDDFKFIDLLKFQLYSYEVNNSEISIEIPNWLECELQKFNFDNFIITTDVEVKKKAKIHKFVLQNILADLELKAEPDNRQYKPHVMLLPKNLTSGDKVKSLLPDINSLYGWYNSLAKNVGNDKSFLLAIVDDIIKGKTTQIEKIKAIYYYIQNNIKYVAFEHGIMGFQPESCQNVLKNKFGDCKGMANLAKEMLQIIGVDARLTWLGTDGTPYNYNYPSVFVDNHMICTILLDGKYIYLDPTEKHNDLFDYADRIQGRQVMIQNNDHYILKNVPLQNEEQHLEQNTLHLKIDGKKLIGDGNILMKGNPKTNFASFIQSSGGKNKDNAINYFIGKNDNNFKAKTSQIQVVPDRDEPFNLRYELTAENQIIESGKEKYINLEYYRPLIKMEIEESRNCSYHHGFKIFEKSQIQLLIPSQHKVKYLPDAITETNELGSFHLGYEVKDDKIFYNKDISLKTTSIPVHSFPMWKDLIKKLSTFFDDRIVLELEN